MLLKRHLTKMQTSDAYSNDSLGISGTISTKYGAIIIAVIKAEKKAKGN